MEQTLVSFAFHRLACDRKLECGCHCSISFLACHVILETLLWLSYWILCQWWRDIVSCLWFVSLCNLHMMSAFSALTCLTSLSYKTMAIQDHQNYAKSMAWGLTLFHLVLQLSPCDTMQWLHCSVASDRAWVEIVRLSWTLYRWWWWCSFWPPPLQFGPHCAVSRYLLLQKVADVCKS